ncbi:MAG: BamA/TamA family outer membrane protein [Acidobacteria bacterium]|nr:BamA/TamA family outer membrane protein [Acidobacteriota bacterium]
MTDWMEQQVHQRSVRFKQWLRWLALGVGLLGLFPTQGRAGTFVVPHLVFEFVPFTPRYVDQTDLRRVAGIGEGELIDDYQLQNALKNLYKLGIFSQIEVSREELGTEERLLFRFHCRGELIEIHWLGVHSLSQRELGELLNMPVTTIVMPGMLESAQSRIVNAYRASGYLDVAVNFRTEVKANGLAMFIEVDEGRRFRFRDIEVMVSRGDPLPEALARARQLRNRFYSENELADTREAIRQVYFDAGYPAVEIESFITPHESLPRFMSVIFNVDTGTHVSVQVTGVFITPQTIEEILAIYRLTDVSEFAEELSRDDLRRYYREQGYATVQVQSRRQQIPEENRVELTFDVTPGPKFEDFRLILEGNETYDRIDLLEGIGQNISRTSLMTTTPAVMAGKIATYYRENGFLTVTVTGREETGDGGYVMIITVDEGPCYRLEQVDWVEDQRVRFGDMPAVVPALYGEVYTRPVADQLNAALLESLSTQGYVVDNLQIEEILREDHVLVTATASYSGPKDLQNMVVIGSPATRERVLAKLITLKAGGPLEMNRVFQTEERLYGSGLFDKVGVTIYPVGGRKDETNLVLQLREAPRYTFGYGFGYNEYEGLRGFVDWSDTNFMGMGQNLNLLLRASSRLVRFQASLLDRFYFPGDLPISLTLFLERNERISFTSRKATIFAQTTRELNERLRLIFRLGYEKIQNFDIQESIDPGELTRDEAPIDLTAAGVVLQYDRRDDIVDPSRGSLSTVDLMFAPKIFGADTGFFKTFFQHQHYFQLQRFLVLATSFRFGNIFTIAGSQEVPISERFFAGGATTLRGYRVDRAGPLDPVTGSPLGGKTLLIGNVEFRFPLFWILGGSAFYDTGNVFRDFSGITWDGISHTIGLGLRLNTGFGPVRFDFGYSLKDIPNERDNQLFFTIGHAF